MLCDLLLSTQVWVLLPSEKAWLKPRTGRDLLPALSMLTAVGAAVIRVGFIPLTSPLSETCILGKKGKARP